MQDVACLSLTIESRTFPCALWDVFCSIEQSFWFQVATSASYVHCRSKEWDHEQTQRAPCLLCVEQVEMVSRQ